MSDISLYKFNGRPVRLVDQNGDPWFVAKDVCDVLETRTDNLQAILDTDEIQKADPYSIGVKTNSPHGIILINESGLYSLILRSRKPEAKSFKKWVTSVVLPSINKYGGYMTPQAVEEMVTSPDSMIKFFTEMKTLHKRIDEQTQTIRVQDCLIADQEHSIQALKPAAEYADRVMDSTRLMPTNLIAKQLNMSAITLNKILHEEGVQYRSGECWVLTTKHQDSGYVKIVTHTITRSDGKPDTVKQMKWTEKGQRFIFDLIDKRNAKQTASPAGQEGA
jgi:prophage antirepressor-like protein